MDCNQNYYGLIVREIINNSDMGLNTHCEFVYFSYK